MLETLRNASKGWLAAILILLLVGSFGIWGVQDMINLTSDPTMAKVGDRKITPDEFQREFTRFLSQMERQSNTQLSSTEAKALGLDREALERMMTREAILQKAKGIGLDISQSQVVDAIKSIPGMSDGKGGINLAGLQQILQQGQMSQAQFMDIVRSDVVREQLVRSLLTGVNMPPGLEAALNRFRLERRTIEYVLLDPSRAGEVKDPDDATLRKYYEANAAKQYSLPEFRTVTFVAARNADVASQLNVSEDEIKRIYDANKSKYVTPEKRVLEQIRFKSEAAARAAKLKLNAGSTFESIAQAEGLKPEDVKLGEVSKTNTSIPAVAFELPLNTNSEPVRGAFGWVILRALSSTPGAVKTIDEARTEIKEALVEALSKEKLFELTNAFEDTRGGGATLEEAAKKHKLTAVKVQVDARGNDTTGKTVDGLPGGDFLQRVFAAERGLDSELTDAGEGVFYEFRVDEITRASKKPLEQVRAEVLSNWRWAEVDKRLQTMADDMVKKGNGGQSIANLATPLGVAPLTSDPLPRYGEHALFGAETLNAAHDAKVGAFFKGPVANGRSVVVARLAGVQYEQESPVAPARTMYSGRLREAFSADFVQVFSDAVRNDVGVTIDEANFKKFHTGE